MSRISDVTQLLMKPDSHKIDNTLPSLLDSIHIFWADDAPRCNDLQLKTYCMFVYNSEQVQTPTSCWCFTEQGMSSRQIL